MTKGLAAYAPRSLIPSTVRCPVCVFSSSLACRLCYPCRLTPPTSTGLNDSKDLKCGSNAHLYDRVAAEANFSDFLSALTFTAAGWPKPFRNAFLPCLHKNELYGYARTTRCDRGAGSVRHAMTRVILPQSALAVRLSAAACYGSSRDDRLFSLRSSAVSGLFHPRPRRFRRSEF